MMIGTPVHARVHFARRLLAAASFACAMAAIGCGSDSPTGPASISGTYTMRTMEGLAPPITVPNPREHNFVIYAVSTTLGDDNTYAVAGTGTRDGHASTVLTDAGTYSRSGTTINFTSSTFGGATFTGKAKTDTITVTLPGGFVDSHNSSFALVFAK